MFYYFMFHYYVLPIFIAHVVGIVIKSVFINQDMWLYLESTLQTMELDSYSVSLATVVRALLLNDWKGKSAALPGHCPGGPVPAAAYAAYREDYNGRPSAIYRSKHCNGRLQACVDRQKSRSTLVNLAINVLRVLRHAHARIFAWLLGTCISETTADIAGNQTSMPEDQRELYTMQTTNAKVSRRQRHRGG